MSILIDNPNPFILGVFVGVLLVISGILANRTMGIPRNLQVLGGITASAGIILLAISAAVLIVGHYNDIPILS